MTSMNADEAADKFDDLIRAICLEICASSHREAKTMGHLFYRIHPLPKNKQPVFGFDLAQVDSTSGCDIYGNFPKNNVVEAKCSKCGRKWPVSSFAKHLDKCLGIGNSSRSTTGSETNPRKSQELV